MRKLDIQIDHAKILNYIVWLEDDKPRVRVEIGLFSMNGKKVSTYTLDSAGYDKDMVLDVPFDLVAPIVSTAEALERIVTAHCQSQMMQLRAHVEDEEI